MPRVFAALLLPHDVCDALARDAKAFARIDPLARFTRSTNLHLTLAFVGEISTIDARRLSAALRPLCALRRATSRSDASVRSIDSAFSTRVSPPPRASIPSSTKSGVPSPNSAFRSTTSPSEPTSRLPATGAAAIRP